ncbi:MAG: cyclic nucleotide-binding domain-containing protein [Cytophagales bacterium]|nr:cyclic nucleotide-binding domain-containing protein [Cytophagales bacterium]
MWKLFRKTYTDEERETFEFLSEIKLFERLTEKEMHLFLPYMYTRNYKVNEAVFFRNDPSRALYLVKEGRVALSLDIEDKFEVLTNLKRGQHFGDNTLLLHSRRLYNAVVRSEKAVLIVLPQVSIYEIFEEHPAIKAKMMTSLAEQYNEYTRNLFRAYKATFGFFNLGQAYLNS